MTEASQNCRLLPATKSGRIRGTVKESAKHFSLTRVAPAKTGAQKSIACHCVDGVARSITPLQITKELQFAKVPLS